MAEKPNKNMVIGIVVAVVAVVAIIVGIVIAKGNEGGVGEGGDETGSGQVEDNVSEMDFSDIDVSVGIGDYDVMYAQSKAIQNGEMTEKIIQIDGYVSHPMSKYSIGERDENGSFIGTEFIIEGVSDDDYPEDGDHVILTGEVIEKEPLYYVIRTAPQYVEIFADEDEIEEIDDVDELDEYDEE